MTGISMTTDYVDVKVKIGAVEFTNAELQIDSIKISNGCYDGSVFGVGNVYVKNANITMNYRGGITKGLSMEIFFLHLGEWISFGQFIVKETPVINGEKLSISLESAIGQTMSTSVVFETVLQKYTLRQIKTRLEEIIGKQIVFIPALTSEEEKSFLDGKSACFLKDIQNYVDQSAIDTGIAVRDMLSGLAILFGGNVYEDVRNRVVIKQKPKYTETENYVPSDYLDSNYKYSQETYSARVIGISFLPWSLSLYYPPNASGQICTVNYLGENRVDNMIQYSPNAENYTAYDYTVSCDWIGWTSDGSTFDTHAPAPGGKYAQCLRQGDLVYKTCEMTFVGIDFHWNVAPGSLVKVKVPELEEPIDVLCGEVSYEWDGGFTTSISCNCNVESSGNYSTQVSTKAMAVAAQEGRQTSLELNYANITFSNIEDSTIRGSIFKDGTIEGSKFKDGTIEGSKIKNSTITGSLIADSTIKGSNIEEGTITGSLIKEGTITDSVFEDGAISGSKIKESTITGSLIADSAITESKISNSSITNSKIKDGEIENAKIKDSTLTGAKIKDATIGFEKVDTSFISDLTADEAYIENLKASIADIGYLTADEADIKFATITSLEAVDGKIDDLKAITITTDNLNAKVAELGYLTSSSADIKYANIELSNIETANVGTLLSNVGLIDRATIVDGHVTGFLDSVEVNANKITAGTLIADRILLKGSEDGLLYALNNLGELTSTTVDTLDGYVLTDRTINADKIVASSITSNELDVDNIFANQAVISKITSQEAFINAISSNTVVVGAKAAADNANNKIDNLEIGGANIFPNSTTLIGGGWTGTMADSNVTVGLSDPTGKNNAISMLGTAKADNYRIIYNLIPEDGTYTLSLWAKSDKAVKIRNFHGDNKFIGEMNLTTEWKKFVFTKENYLKGDRVYFGGGSTWVQGVKLYVAYPKLEKGNKATDWTAAQSDISVKNIYTPNTTTIDGGKITTNSIKASSIDVDNLFAQTITATGIIKGATLVGASISADKGTIGGFSIFENWLVGSYDDNAYQYQVELNTNKTYSNEKNDVYAIHVQKINKSTSDTESEWYVTYNGYMHAEIGKIAGFTLQDQKLTAQSILDQESGGDYYLNAKIDSNFDLEENQFLTLTCEQNEEIKNKAIYGLDKIRLETNKIEYYGKNVEVSPRGISVSSDGTPYNNSNIAFQVDSGYAPLSSNGEFSISPSCTINVPTTVKSLTIKNNGSNGKTVISNGLIGLDDIQGGTVRYFIDNTYGNLRIWDTKVGERLLFSSNSIIFKPKGATVLSINETKAVENGYEIIGCTVTTSGNFTCKKYRDGRLIIECRSKTTSMIGMTIQDTSGIYYAKGAGGTFPIEFTDVPSIVCGLSVPDGTCPFAHVTFDGISKTGYGRQMFWSSFSGNTLPVGTVVSATFTGRWK